MTDSEVLLNRIYGRVREEGTERTVRDGEIARVAEVRDFGHGGTVRGVG